MKIYNLFTRAKAVGMCFALGSLLMACTGNFDDFNKNPYEPDDTDLEGDNFKLGAFFPQLQRQVVPVQENDYQMCENMIGDVYGGYMAIPGPFQGTNFSYFNPGESWIDYPFNTILGKAYGAFVKIQEYTKGEGVNFAWAKILKVAVMQRMTDLYGPIPYSQVANGELAAPYDSQEQVYKTMFQELDEAINVLTSYVGGNPGAAPMKDYDEVYGGNFEKWVKFANSLKLRMAMRIVYADPVSAKKYAEEAVGHVIGVITSNVDNAQIACEKNPLNVMWDAYTDIRVGADICSYMTGYEDPRMEKYFQEGTVKGKTGYLALRSYIPLVKNDNLGYSSPVVGKTDPLLWLNAAEVAFLKAEGAMRGWNMGGSDEDFYNEGIRLSFEQHGLADKAEAYLTNENKKPATYVDARGVYSAAEPQSEITIKWTSAAGEEEKLERIITQKWIAMWPLGQEAWSEFRRTGYPKLLPALQNLSGGTVNSKRLMRRLPFPPSEYRNNQANVLEAVKMLKGGDTGGTNLWWDAK